MPIPWRVWLVWAAALIGAVLLIAWTVMRASAQPAAPAALPCEERLAMTALYADLTRSQQEQVVDQLRRQLAEALTRIEAARKEAPAPVPGVRK